MHTLLADASGAAVAGGLGLIWLVLVGLAIVLSIFWIWMLIDAITSNMAGTQKLIWVLVILFTHIIGAAIYFFVARGKSGGGITTA